MNIINKYEDAKVLSAKVLSTYEDDHEIMYDNLFITDKGNVIISQYWCNENPLQTQNDENIETVQSIFEEEIEKVKEVAENNSDDAVDIIKEGTEENIKEAESHNDGSAKWNGKQYESESLRDIGDGLRAKSEYMKLEK